MNVSEQTCKITVLGESREYKKGTTYETIAAEFQHLYQGDILLAVFENTIRELNKTVERDGEISFLTAGRQGQEEKHTGEA